MAGTQTVSTVESFPGGSCRDTTAQHNALVTDVEALRAQLAAAVNLSNYRALGNPGFAIDTNFDVKNANAISYTNGGTLKSLSANTSFNTGTSKTIPTTKWAAALLSASSGGTATVTWTSSTYDSEALAIAALASPGATHTLFGYVTVQAAGSTWTAGTDALASGSGGTPANATNYYNDINPNNLMFTATSTDAAGDMTAAQVGDHSGNVITATVGTQ